MKPFIPTHEISCDDGSKLLVMCEEGALFTKAEWNDVHETHGVYAWELDEYNDLVFRGGNPPSGTTYRELSKLEPHFIVDDVPEHGAFTVGQFLLANLDASPPVHEILMMMLLEVGSLCTFGGGAMAETPIRRVR